MPRNVVSTQHHEEHRKNAIQQLVQGFNEFAQDNVHVQQNNCGAISILTISKKMSEIVSVTEKSRPDLFHEGISMFAGNTNTSNTNNRNQLKKTWDFRKMNKTFCH